MQNIHKNVYVILLFILIINICIIKLSLATNENSSKFYTKERKLELREDVRRMFQHAYDSYLKYASNYDELRPLTCDGHDTWGSYSLTLIDALDTLATMGNFTEFRRVVSLLEKKMDFDKDINVSVFETNIRIVGGLLSAHLLSKHADVRLAKGWPCQGPLLRLAEDVAKRLLPAFDTATGMPYGTVNLRYGVPKGETSVTCTAGVGTFLIEFGTLSRLTGNSIYEEVALNAIYALWERRSPIGLFGNHIDVQSGRWTALDSGIGAGVDSFFEYLVKGALLLNRPELLKLFHEAREPIDKYLRKEDWYIWAGMNKGHVTLPVFQSLESFWPGILSMIGDHGPAMRTMKNYISVWNKYGFLPEFYNIPTGEASVNREVYPLRPELIESAMYLYRSTKNQLLLELGENMLETLEFSAKTKCGYATIRNVVTHEKENRMESFFLAETTKYLYLLFDENNFLHNMGANGDHLQTEQGGECIVNAGAYIFNTEAHPMDMSALYCCHDIKDDIYTELNFDMYRDNAYMKAERDKRESKFNTENPCDYRRRMMINSNNEIIKQKKPQQRNTKKEKNSDTDTDATTSTSNTISVDIHVFDEHNNPADELLIQNFERVIHSDSDNNKNITTDFNLLTIQQQQILSTSSSSSATPTLTSTEAETAAALSSSSSSSIVEPQSSALPASGSKSKLQRNQLTVNDLQSFFSRTSEEFNNAHDTLTYVKSFMQNFTMDETFIRGLHILNKNFTRILGISIQKEFESQMRTLWDLYELEQNYKANIILITKLFNDKRKTIRNLNELLNMIDGLYTNETFANNNDDAGDDAGDHHHQNSSSNENENLKLNIKYMHITRLIYEFSLVNTTAMQEFLQRIYFLGTNEKKFKLLPLLNDEELKMLKPKTLTIIEQRNLFIYTRRIIDLKIRIIDTVERLQMLMDEQKQKEMQTQDQHLDESTAPGTTPPPSSSSTTESTASTSNSKPNNSLNIKSSSSSTDDTRPIDTDDGGGGGGDDSDGDNDDDNDSNTSSLSVWSQLIQTILRKTTRSSSKKKFNENLLQQKTLKSLKKFTSNRLMNQYELFTCKRPNYIENFVYRDFYPIF